MILCGLWMKKMSHFAKSLSIFLMCQWSTCEYTLLQINQINFSCSATSTWTKENSLLFNTPWFSFQQEVYSATHCSLTQSREGEKAPWGLREKWNTRKMDHCESYLPGGRQDNGKQVERSRMKREARERRAREKHLLYSWQKCRQDEHMCEWLLHVQAGWRMKNCTQNKLAHRIWLCGKKSEGKSFGLIVTTLADCHPPRLTTKVSPRELSLNPPNRCLGEWF